MHIAPAALSGPLCTECRARPATLPVESDAVIQSNNNRNNEPKRSTRTKAIGRVTTMPSTSNSSSSSKGSNPLVSIIDRRIDQSGYREQHWEGTLWEYLDLA